MRDKLHKVMYKKQKYINIHLISLIMLGIFWKLPNILIYNLTVQIDTKITLLWSREIE